MTFFCIREMSAPALTGDPPAIAVAPRFLDIARVHDYSLTSVKGAGRVTRAQTALTTPTRGDGDKEAQTWT